jgi:branched-chain amino acid transport system substrate-binding protein
MGYGYAVNEQFVAGAGKEVAENIFAMESVPDAKSTAYAHLQSKLKRDSVDIYTCHGYDEVNLAVLAIAAAKMATGTAIRDHMRVVGDPNGVQVDNAVDGIKALSEGKTVNYLGASGPCKFTSIGDVITGHFRFSTVKNGKFVDYRTL